MTSYADKPWLKSYKIGAFKLKTTIDYPVLCYNKKQCASKFYTKNWTRKY